MEHVSKYFGEKAALDGVNLQIRESELMTILGPSGRGKTTLLRLIADFQMTSEGVITVSGREITQIPPHKRSADTVLRKYTLFPHLNAYNSIAFDLELKRLPSATIEKEVRRALKMVGLTGYENRDVDSLSGNQQQRVAIVRTIVNEPRVLLLDEPLAALGLKMCEDIQMGLKEMHKSLGITFMCATHDQEEALTLGDTIVIISEGKIQQVGTPIDIYDEPVSSPVADFIGESNILSGTMIKDRRVSFVNHEFKYVDEGLGEQMPVDVMLRPEDIYISEPSEVAMLAGTVASFIFEGVHCEVIVQAPNECKFMVQDYHPFKADSEVESLIKPFDIHVMKKERVCNTLEGKLIDATHVGFPDYMFECREVIDIEPNTSVRVEIDFKDVILGDNEEDGHLTGEVKFILCRDNHYHLAVSTDWGEDIFVDTNNVRDDGDHVGITIAPDRIRITHAQKGKEVINTPSAFFMRRRNQIIPYILFLAIFIMILLLSIIYYVFTNNERMFTFTSFHKLMVHLEVTDTFIYSVGIALITTTLCLLLGYPTARILSQARFNTPHAMVVSSILPMWVDILTRTSATVALLDFLDFPLKEGTLIFGIVYNFLLLMIYPIYNTLQKMDHSLIKTAQNLGASPSRVFVKAVFPLSMSGVMNNIMMVFMPTISTFAIAELLTMSSIEFFGATIQKNINNSMWNYGVVLSLIMLLLIGITRLFSNESNGSTNEGGLI